MMHEVEIATLFIIIRFRRDVVLFAVSFCVTGPPTKTDSMKNEMRTCVFLDKLAASY